MPRRVAAIVLFMFGVAGFAVAVLWGAFAAAMAAIAKRGRGDLSQASDWQERGLSRNFQVAGARSDRPALTRITGPNAIAATAQPVVRQACALGAMASQPGEPQA